MNDPMQPHPKETHRARQAFKDFLGLGGGRSLEKLRAMYLGCSESTPPTTVLRTLKDWSSRHAWQERARTWDAEQGRKELDHTSERMSEERRKWRDRRIKLLDAHYSIVARMMNAFSGAQGRDAIPCSASDLDRALRTLMTESRIEMADKPTPGHELIGPDGNPVVSIGNVQAAFKEMRDVVKKHVENDTLESILDEWMAISLDRKGR